MKTQTGCRRSDEDYPSEEAVYKKFGPSIIAPALRDDGMKWNSPVAAKPPTLLTVADIRGELHAHSTSSDGSKSTTDCHRAEFPKKISGSRFVTLAQRKGQPPSRQAI